MTDTAKANFDPVTLEILWSRLISIADESAAALLRTSFSTIVRESNDFATVLMDSNGDSLAENTAGIPSFVGMLPDALKNFIKRIPIENWNPGDCIITNDPWIGSGHLPDITMAAPIFHKGKLVGFSGSIAHLPDIGGAGWSSDGRELFEEGIRLMPMKFLKEGEPNQDVFDFITANVRVPSQVIGDIYAQVTAQQVCAGRLQEFLDDAQLNDLTGLSGALLERADIAMRKAIEEVPDGTYRAAVDADGYDEDETHIECAITVNGSDLHINYDGTSKQINRGLNSVMKYTYAYSTYPVKCALDPDTPRNEGSYRSVTVAAPEGSILNPTFPAPVNARQLTGHLLAAAIYECLAQAVPDKVIAECGGAPTMRSVYSGIDDGGNRFSQIFFASGGMGASPVADGHSCTAFPTNSGSGSIEAFESLAPLLVWKKEFRTDSGGAGQFMGGLGQEVEIEITAEDDVRLSMMSDRQKYAAKGLLGGLEGAKVEIDKSDGTKPHPKARSVLAPGDKLTLLFGGGGGYGPPDARDPDAVQNDLRNGYITAEYAKRHYGID
ncbi:MAG: hydantoinase B/oxoprolinase family protein [Alphaproteobacteria bacterium]